MSNQFFILKPQDSKIYELDHFLDQAKFEFSEFVKAEAKLVDQSKDNQNPEYLNLAKKFGFQWQNYADKGNLLYDWKAQLMMELVQRYARKLNHSIGFPVYEIKGSNIYNQAHPVVDSYAKLYGERLYNMQPKKQKLVMSYDSSYPHFSLASQNLKYEKQLPFGYFSIADCYRYEQSGELMLMLRHRRFFMNDIHPFFKDINQAFDWIPRMANLILDSGKKANLDYQIVIEIPSFQNFNDYQDQIHKVINQINKPVLINILNDGKDRYWVFNMDFKFVDKLGQAREIACVQIDIGNSQKMNIQFQDSSSNKQKHPVIIHSAIPGGVERYLYMLFDDFKKRCPIFMQPIQARIIPVSQKHLQEAIKIQKEFENLVRIDIDDRDINLNLKIKQAHKELIPNKIILGDKEDISQIKEQIQEIAHQNQEFEFLKLNVPHLLSQRHF